jgi:hypothetical protein
MCHDRWMRRWRGRDEELDEELRFMFDERERSEPPAPVVEHERDEEPAGPEPERV